MAVGAGGGMLHEHIALALGISLPTLRKHFEHELSVGAFNKRLDVLNAMQRAAAKGSVSAAKAYFAIEPQLAAPPAEQPSAPAPQARTAQPTVELGKKAKAQVDAVTAHVGTQWDELLGPRPPVQ